MKKSLTLLILLIALQAQTNDDLFTIRYHIAILDNDKISRAFLTDKLPLRTNELWYFKDILKNRNIYISCNTLIITEVIRPIKQLITTNIITNSEVEIETNK